MRIDSKMFYAVAAAVALMGISVSGARAALNYTQTVENTPGLLAYYQFSGNTNSSVGGFTGTATAGATIDAAGSGPVLADDPTNSALKLDGTNGNEVQTSLTGGVSTAGSILAWVNLAELPSTAGRFFYVAGQSTGGDDLDLQIQNDDRIYFYTEGGANVSTGPLTSANLNQWIFIAATFTANGDRNLYINGTLAATNTPGGHNASGNSFTIGYSNVFGGRAFDGDIDEVAFYGTDLSASQVGAIFASATVATPEPAGLGVLAIGAMALLRRKRVG